MYSQSTTKYITSGSTQYSTETVQKCDSVALSPIWLYSLYAPRVYAPMQLSKHQLQIPMATHGHGRSLLQSDCSSGVGNTRQRAALKMLSGAACSTEHLHLRFDRQIYNYCPLLSFLTPTYDSSV